MCLTEAYKCVNIFLQIILGIQREDVQYYWVLIYEYFARISFYFVIVEIYERETQSKLLSQLTV